MYGRFIEIQSNLRRNFVERIKAPIFLEAVLAIDIMQEPQLNLQEKVDPGILKDHFSSRTGPSIFTSIEPLWLIDYMTDYMIYYMFEYSNMINQ